MTKEPYYHIIILLYYCMTNRKSYRIIVLLYYCMTKEPYYHIIVLLYYYTIELTWHGYCKAKIMPVYYVAQLDYKKVIHNTA